MASWLVRSSPDRAVRVRALAGGHCAVFLGNMTHFTLTVPPTQEYKWVPANCFRLSGRRGGLMVSALVPGSSGPGSSPGRGTLCCVLGQHDPLYSHSASHPGGNLTNCWGVTCDGLASRPGGVLVLSDCRVLPKLMDDFVHEQKRVLTSVLFFPEKTLETNELMTIASGEVNTILFTW